MRIFITCQQRRFDTPSSVWHSAHFWFSFAIPDSVADSYVVPSATREGPAPAPRFSECWKFSSPIFSHVTRQHQRFADHTHNLVLARLPVLAVHSVPLTTSLAQFHVPDLSDPVVLSFTLTFGIEE
jgi:hypothetical protein